MGRFISGAWWLFLALLLLRWAREMWEFLLSLSGGVACDTSTSTGAQNICVTLSLPVQNVKLKPPLHTTNASKWKTT